MASCKITTVQSVFEDTKSTNYTQLIHCKRPRDNFYQVKKRSRI